MEPLASNRGRVGRELHLRLVRDLLHVLLLLAAEPLNLKRRLLLEHLLAIEPLHLLCWRISSGVICAFLRAASFSSRAFLAMPQLVEVGLRAGGHRLGVQHQRVVLARSSGTFLLPAKISWRPCSSYHLVSVAVMCIFSMMFRQPMPVL